MQSERIEIVDFSGEKFSKFTMPCWVVFVVISIIAILDSYLMIVYPESPYALVLGIILISIFIYYYVSVATKSPGKLRKFSISHEDIEITLPYTPLFIVDWAEFERIKITLKKLELKPFNVYRFQFIGKESEKKVMISLLDFHKEKLEEIVQILRKYAILMKKDFSAVKETNVSGVYLVEDLS
ncbi:MAG: hypothetical protein KGD65_04825 [Candidatus Lokiarchaeota archaeon]|nr:hypothetical protein [Candidatus Lokiarchaeota archaeon]